MPVTALTSTIPLATGLGIAHTEHESECERVKTARRDSVFSRKLHTVLRISLLGTFDSHLTKVTTNNLLLNDHSPRCLLLTIDRADVVPALRVYNQRESIQECCPQLFAAGSSPHKSRFKCYFFLRGVFLKLLSPFWPFAIIVLFIVPTTSYNYLADVASYL